ncbi:FTR1 family iron permease [Sulfobacillus thermosulfidooxidans]|uniref:FTR1 family iron permease n=1 Tax=Sulfobacillus thermosulfidooxidans TaxID=28034 RepID=UPI0006B66C57|nr:FTR1 family protein [Sulfobacillus thermosulfidooxidans]
MLATAVIFARESLEASLIVAIIFSYLKQIHAPPNLYGQVWTGILIALTIDGFLGMVIWFTIHAYTGTSLQTILEALTYVLAAILLTGMSFWMKNQSPHLKRDLQEHVEKSLNDSKRWALVLLAGITVGREGLETTVFILALSFHTTSGAMILGALIGLGIGIYASYAIYHLGRGLPLRTFFNVFGTLLLIFASALLADGVEDFQNIHWLPGGHWILWNTGHFLSESSVLGDILHTFVGYAQSPTGLQMGVYVGFLLLTIPRYLKVSPKIPVRS